MPTDHRSQNKEDGLAGPGAFQAENDSTNILKGEEPRDIVAAGESGERETNPPNQFKAPRAVEERETNVTCQGETAENTGAREINVPEKETAAVRRDGGPLTIADQQLRKKGVQRPADHPAEPRREGARKTPREQPVWILVRGRRSGDANPT